MTPFDCYKKAWFGDDDNSTKSADNSNPFLDVFSDTINDFMHQSATQAVSQSIVDEAVRQNLICAYTGQQILPVVEFVMDRVLP